VSLEWRNVVITGVGSSLAVVLATIAYFSISRKGFRFSFSNLLQYQNVELDQNDNEESETLFNDENNSPSEANSESVDYVSDNVDSSKFSSWLICEFERICKLLLPFALTSLYFSINRKNSPCRYSGCCGCCSTGSNSSFKETKGLFRETCS
jgi:hypothetical protein